MHVAMHGVVRPHQDSPRTTGAGQAGNATSFASLIDNLPGEVGGGANAKAPPIGGAGSGNPNITPPVGSVPPVDLSGIGNLPAAFGGDASMLADMVLVDGGETPETGDQTPSRAAGPPVAADSSDLTEGITAAAGTAAAAGLQTLLLLSEI